MDRVLEILCWLLLFTRYRPDIYVPIEKDLVSPFNISSAVDNCLIPASIKTGLNQAIDFPADKEHLKSLLSISDFCRTPDCLRAAADILSNLDETAKPCDDFYKFACGGWIKRQNIPEDKLTFNVFEKARSDVKIKFRALLRKELTGAEPDYIHMVKRLYDSCIDLKSIEKAGSKPLRNALRDLGGWPVLEGKHWNETSFDWIATLTEFRKMGFDHNILMNLVVTRDAKNNMTPILKLDKVLLFGMGREKLSHGLNDSAIDAYFRLMVKTANQLGANENTSETELRETLDFEIMLANLSSTHGAFIKSPARMSFRELYNMSLDYTNDKYTVRKLVDTLPQIDWLKYFSDVLNATISENEPLIIKDPDFIVRLVNFITQTKKR
ncbi:neprilysin-2-like, partial [Stegodyphus dumicola]|uniref:neprilysin-2-like n=1 Tax=Stegodyphus dumicola TaxID=202533 RepID=UPI0015A969EE